MYDKDGWVSQLTQTPFVIRSITYDQSLGTSNCNRNILVFLSNIDLLWAVTATSLYAIDPFSGQYAEVGAHGLSLTPGTHSGLSIGNEYP